MVRLRTPLSRIVDVYLQLTNGLGEDFDLRLHLGLLLLHKVNW